MDFRQKMIESVTKDIESTMSAFECEYEEAEKMVRKESCSGEVIFREARKAITVDS